LDPIFKKKFSYYKLRCKISRRSANGTRRSRGEKKTSVVKQESFRRLSFPGGLTKRELMDPLKNRQQRWLGVGTCVATWFFGENSVSSSTSRK